MSARSDILGSIRSNKPDAGERPDWVPPAGLASPERFVAALEAAGGRVVRASRATVQRELALAYPDAKMIASTSASMSGSTTVDESMDTKELAEIDLFVCDCVLGVAENGAVWVPHSRLAQRAAAFAAEHMAVVLDSAAIVATLHDAYDSLEIEKEPYGVFIAGPSKTADIEQSLVLGAHGPATFTVVLV